MRCEHLQNGLCLVASQLAEVDVRPLISQCDYCTQKASPPQAINKVTVSLALSVRPPNRDEILNNYKLLLAGGEDILERQRKHWRTLHTTRMDAESFAVWLDAIPKQCDCRKAFDSLLEGNPPRYGDWQRWTWEIHNAVNAKLNKTEVAWDDAASLWNWNNVHHQTTEN